MAKYRVSCWLTQRGYYYIEARNKKEAEDIAISQLRFGQRLDSTTDDDSGGIYGVYRDD
jgi:hypothetical protein